MIAPRALIRLPDAVANNVGTSAIEFAILAPVFLGLLLGVFEFATFVGYRQDLSSAVSRAGRYASVHGSSSSSPATTTALASLVGTYLNYMPAAAISPSASFSPNNNPGGTVTITASYSWRPFTSFVAMPNITITAKSVQTILN
jgi:Flp pilus assembly protein TadG